MGDYTDEMLYLLFGLPALLLAFVLFMLGPLGWFTGAFLLLGVMVVSSLRNADEGATPGGNCPDCGAPIGPDAATCEYCGEAV